MKALLPTLVGSWSDQHIIYAPIVWQLVQNAVITLRNVLSPLWGFTYSIVKTGYVIPTFGGAG